MVATLSGSPGFGVGGPGCLILELGGDPTYNLFWSEVFRGRVMHRLDAPAPYGCCRDFCRLRCQLPSIFGIVALVPILLVHRLTMCLKKHEYGELWRHAEAPAAANARSAPPAEVVERM